MPTAKTANYLAPAPPPPEAAPAPVPFIESHNPPRRGLPLAAVLGVTISVLVTLLLGGLTALQLRRDERSELSVREGLLAESLVPLAEEVEQAADLGEIEQHLSSCRVSEIALGRSDYNVVLRNADGRVLASADAEGPVSPPEGSLQASRPVHSRVLSTGRGALTAWQDTSVLSAEMVARRRGAWVDIGATVLTIILVVQLAIFFLVSRPLHRLLTAIEKFEQGYPSGFQDGAIASELIGLEWRLHRMSVGLTNSARLLVAAHKRATETSKGRRMTNLAPEPLDPLDLHHTSKAVGNEVMRRYLLDRCALLEGSSPEDAGDRELALEVWEHDAVQAERFGEMDLRARLEDSALAVLEPHAFDRVRIDLDSLVAARDVWRRKISDLIVSAVAADGVSGAAIQHRTKHAAGVWRKMREKNLTLEEVYDLFAFRIIVPGLDDCYLALATVHRLFEPEPFRFKDYIASPKSNGYQSLHTSVRDRGGLVFELQIRTLDMHRAAEEGQAAHWRYRARKSILA